MLRKLLEVQRQLIDKTLSTTMGKGKRFFKHKNKKKERDFNQNERIQRPSKNVYFQVIWSGTDGHPPCLFLFTDSKRYIFNCTEGTQRLFTQNRVKIGKLDTFFFTRHQWSHLGGFPGFAMTLRDSTNAANLGQLLATQKPQDVKKKLTVNVYGPDGIQNVLAAAHGFMKFDKSGMCLETHEYGKNKVGKIYEDIELAVQPIPIFGSAPVSASGMSFSRHRLLEPLMPSLTHAPPALCFGIHLKPLPGKFDPVRANELGVPSGPLRGQLQAGIEVTLDNGTVVKKSDVCDPDIPGTHILIVDCPSISFIDSLTTNNILQKYTVKGEQQAGLVLHLSPQTVCDNPKYVKWIKKFQLETRHTFANNIPHNIPVFRGQYSLQAMLNVVDQNIFPLIEQNVKPEIGKTDILYNLTKIQLRGISSNSVECFDHSSSFKEDKIEKLQEIAQTALDTFKNQSKETEYELKSDEGRKRQVKENGAESGVTENKKLHLDATPKAKSYPQVLFLGTGAAIPSKYRNVSATLLFLSENNGVLLDCGEDTYGQLFRHYGNKIDNVLKRIKMILISHLHADHHLGLFTLLSRISAVKTPDQNVVVVAPYYYRNWFMSYAETSQPLHCQFVSCRSTLDGSWLTKEIFVKSIKVDHPASAHGFMVKDKKHSVVYSGDTKPCQRLIQEGQNCTMLIHEATLEDEMFEDALTRKHSTTSQALDVAHQMKAKNLVMTHFSQRYPRIPKLKNTPITSHCAIAFDHMELSLEDVPKFQHYIPKIVQMFDLREKDETEEDEKEKKNNEEEKKNKEEERTKNTQSNERQNDRRANNDDSDRKRNEFDGRRAGGSGTKNYQMNNCADEKTKSDSIGKDDSIINVGLDKKAVSVDQNTDPVKTTDDKEDDNYDATNMCKNDDENVNKPSDDTDCKSDKNIETVSMDVEVDCKKQETENVNKHLGDVKSDCKATKEE
eukprot:TCONS_00003881-protein